MMYDSDSASAISPAELAISPTIAAKSVEAAPNPGVIDNNTLLQFLPEFIQIYRRRVMQTNRGGMGFNHSFATFAIARFLDPRHIIESGVFRGHSTWILEQACPHAEIYALDPYLETRRYISHRASYSSDDFSSIDWSSIDRSKALCVFDDHQSAYTRIKDMHWWGFRWGLFDDNYPCGEGDCYSLRHALAGFGHQRINMSRTFAGNPIKRVMRFIDQIALLRLYDRQEVLRRPNRVDAVGLQLNFQTVQEIPPVVRYPKTIWGTPWTGAYASKPPLISEPNKSDFAHDLEAFERADPDCMYHYNYICFVCLR
jgi:hypothetical protein